MFTWEDGHPYSPDYVSHTFHKLLKKYDLPHIRFHDLRYPNLNKIQTFCI